jgi:hypothetical protein
METWQKEAALYWQEAFNAHLDRTSNFFFANERQAKEQKNLLRPTATQS